MTGTPTQVPSSLIDEIKGALVSPDGYRTILADFVLPLVLGVLAYFASAMFSRWSDRRRIGRNGAAICSELLEEIEQGLRSITKLLSPGAEKPQQLPSGTWRGIDSIPLDVLDRLIGFKQPQTDEHFRLTEIRTHLKNYFEHIVPSINKAISTNAFDLKNTNHTNLLEENEESTRKVLETLKQAKDLLTKDSKKWFP